MQVDPTQVISPDLPGRKVGIMGCAGDTLPAASHLEGADVLVHPVTSAAVSFNWLLCWQVCYAQVLKCRSKVMCCRGSVHVKRPQTYATLDFPKAFALPPAIAVVPWAPANLGTLLATQKLSLCIACDLPSHGPQSGPYLFSGACWNKVHE